MTEGKNILVLENKIFSQIETMTWDGLQPRSQALSSCRYVIGSIQENRLAFFALCKCQ